MTVITQKNLENDLKFINDSLRRRLRDFIWQLNSHSSMWGQYGEDCIFDGWIEDILSYMDDLPGKSHGETIKIKNAKNNLLIRNQALVVHTSYKFRECREMVEDLEVELDETLKVVAALGPNEYVYNAKLKLDGILSCLIIRQECSKRFELDEFFMPSHEYVLSNLKNYLVKGKISILDGIEVIENIFYEIYEEIDQLIMRAVKAMELNVSGIRKALEIIRKEMHLDFPPLKLPTVSQLDPELSSRSFDKDTRTQGTIVKYSFDMRTEFEGLAPPPPEFPQFYLRFTKRDIENDLFEQDKLINQCFLEMKTEVEEGIKLIYKLKGSYSPEKHWNEVMGLVERRPQLTEKDVTKGYEYFKDCLDFQNDQVGTYIKFFKSQIDGLGTLKSMLDQNLSNHTACSDAKINSERAKCEIYWRLREYRETLSAALKAAYSFIIECECDTVTATNNIKIELDNEISTGCRPLTPVTFLLDGSGMSFFLDDNDSYPKSEFCRILSSLEYVSASRNEVREAIEAAGGEIVQIGSNNIRQPMCNIC